MRPTSLCLALALTASPGCFLFHDPGSSADAGSPRRDAGAGSGFDAGEPLRRDAGAHDAGPPLPREPEPDPGAEGRPSDDPDADDWVDPAEIGEDDPCCVLGDPVRVTSRDEGMSLSHEPPLIAWGPGRWAIAVARYFERSDGMVYRLVVFELAPDGSVLGDARILDVPALEPETQPGAEALHWAAGRWGLAVAGDSTTAVEHELYVRTFDAAFVGASAWLPIPSGTVAYLAHLAHGDQWLAVTSRSGALSTTPFDELAGVSASTEVSGASWGGALGAAGFGSRAAIAPLTLPRGEEEAGGELVVVDPGGRELGRVGLGGGAVYDGAIAALRDVAVVAAVREHRVEVEVLDPFALRSVAAPRVIGDASSGVSDFAHRDSVDVAGSAKFGIAGVCWGVPGGSAGSREDSRILFRTVGPDGRPRGAATTIVSSPFRGSMVNCSVGSDDLGFLVGWWNGSELWVRRVDIAND